MRDPQDPGTGELLKRPRGRPATGHAKSDVERAQSYRKRQRARQVHASHRPSEASTTLLLRELKALCADDPRMHTWAERGQRVHAILRELAKRFPAK